MADEQKTKLRLEIAHVLFLDIVGYSKLLIDEQSEALQELNQLVRNHGSSARSGSSRPAHYPAYRRWHGIGLYRLGGRAGRVRAPDQSCVAGATEFASANGHPQWAGPSRERRE